MTPTITEDDVFTAIRAYLLAVGPVGLEVIQAQNNRVPEPASADFIVMTPTNRGRLATNVDTWDATDPNPVTITLAHNARFDLQLDIHGALGSDIAAVIATTFPDAFGCDMLRPAGVAPLYASEGHQMPFVNGEQQYENRWTMTLSAQIKPAVSTPAQFAATLTTTVNPALGG